MLLGLGETVEFGYALDLVLVERLPHVGGN